MKPQTRKPRPLALAPTPTPDTGSHEPETDVTGTEWKSPDEWADELQVEETDREDIKRRGGRAKRPPVLGNEGRVHKDNADSAVQEVRDSKMTAIEQTRRLQRRAEDGGRDGAVERAGGAEMGAVRREYRVEAASIHEMHRRFAQGVATFADGRETLFHLSLRSDNFGERVTTFKRSTRDYANVSKGGWIVDGSTKRAQAIAECLGIAEIDRAQLEAAQGFEERRHAVARAIMTDTYRQGAE